MNLETSNFYDMDVVRNAISPSRGRHSLRRVLAVDSISGSLVDYINRGAAHAIVPMQSMSVALAKVGGNAAERRRYQYHGGESGRMDGFFMPADADVFVWRRDDSTVCAASIPLYNVAHLICDLLADESDCESAVEWMSSGGLVERSARAIRKTGVCGG